MSLIWLNLGTVGLSEEKMLNIWNLKYENRHKSTTKLIIAYLLSLNAKTDMKQSFSQTLYHTPTSITKNSWIELFTTRSASTWKCRESIYAKPWAAANYRYTYFTTERRNLAHYSWKIFPNKKSYKMSG